MTHHVLKSWTYLFDQLAAGNKTADMRDMRERNYKVGDTCTMQRFDQALGKYTGETAEVLITHIISRDTPCAMSSVALNRDHCILSLKLLSVTDAPRPVQND